ncbi:MAG: fibrillarin-like rRNA/tRNA 2'-O-methyltransferase [Candidatus Aenigmarchaeota archaeon]|nr:fibrillarin-like rRNA/tRNA 2'-O-methyltransferase [Candidatus Aenigmarchaeota archaeon]
MSKRRNKQKERHNFEDTFWVDNKLCTKNLIPGKKVYDEFLIKSKQGELRTWDQRRSKPSAAIHKGLHQFPLKQGMKVLYLGIASGTTASHFSDIVGREGLIYGIEISDRVLREILTIARERENIVPILADGRKPETYPWIEQVDLVYADIAIKDQSEVLIRNSKVFLKEDGFAMIAIKSRSIDVTKRPTEVYKQEREKLEQFFNVIDFVTLEPFERDHGYFVLKRKK